jgi:hypothetical protein
MNKKLKAALTTLAILGFIALFCYAVINNFKLTLTVLMIVVTISFIIYLYKALLLIFND